MILKIRPLSKSLPVTHPRANTPKPCLTFFQFCQCILIIMWKNCTYNVHTVHSLYSCCTENIARIQLRVKNKQDSLYTKEEHIGLNITCHKTCHETCHLTCHKTCYKTCHKTFHRNCHKTCQKTCPQNCHKTCHETCHKISSKQFKSS